MAWDVDGTWRVAVLAAALGLTLGCGGSRSTDDGSGTSAGTGSGPGSSSSVGSTSVATSEGEAETTASSASASADDTTSGGFKFDLDPSPDFGQTMCPGGGDGGGGDTMFSYIWVANSSQGTVSKINTQTGVEEGRYYTHPNQGSGNPSRTSVNLLGDVAVSNREPGGITKIAAELSRCQDQNGNGSIETSTGPADILPWGEDECVLWHLPIPTSQYNYGPRPTAWEGGNSTEECVVDPNPRLWIAYKDEVSQHGVILRIDGATGEVLDEVEGPIWVGISSMGPYGGAVNAAGDFIISGLNYGNVIVVDAETLAITEVTDGPQDKYGMALDADGNLWVGGFQTNVHHYDFTTQTWTSLTDVGGSRVNGITVDRDGIAWGAGSSPCRLVKIDGATQTVIDGEIALPGCVSPWGISIDAEGYVWVVDMGADRAFKVDPDSHQVVLEVTGLVDPYTYSDMTGSGLNLVVDPPG